MVEKGHGELEFYLMSEKRNEKCLLFMSEINRGRDKWEQNILMSFKI